MDYKKVGKVSHFFDKILVAVIEASDDSFKVGDTLRFGEEGALEEKVESLQVDHKSVDSIEKGKEGAMKVSAEIKSGVEVYKAI
jgi:U32 family peptidase